MPSIGSLCVCSFYLFIFFTFYHSPEKVTFSGTQKPTTPTDFNLQALDWVHCEEELGAYYQLSRLTYIYIYKLLILPQKICPLQKIPQNVLFI